MRVLQRTNLCKLLADVCALQLRAPPATRQFADSVEFGRTHALGAPSPSKLDCRAVNHFPTRLLFGSFSSLRLFSNSITSTCDASQQATRLRETRQDLLMLLFLLFLQIFKQSPQEDARVCPSCSTSFRHHLDTVERKQDI